MEHLLTNISLAVTPIIAFMTLCLTAYNAFRDRSYPVLVNALQEFYAPLYVLLQPCDKSSIPDDVIDEALALCKKHSEYMDRSLRHAYEKMIVDRSNASAFYDAACMSYLRSSKLVGIQHPHLSDYASVSKIHFILFALRGCVIAFAVDLICVILLAFLIHLF